MKIKELSVFRYGPLRNADVFQLGSFNLFFGYNENGKTLTVEALVRLLLGKEASNFTNINRVGENPEGYVALGMADGTEIKLPEAGTLMSVAGISARDCHNLMVVRNSELSIGGENAYYHEVTGRLTGTRTAEIDQAIRAIRNEARLTDGGSFLNKGDEKLKSRLDQAENLCRRDRQLITDMEEAGYEASKNELTALNIQIDELRKNIDEMDQARREDKLKKGRQALESLKISQKKVNDLAAFNEDDERTLNQTGTIFASDEKMSSRMGQEIETATKEIRQMENIINAREVFLENMLTRKRQMENKLRPDMISYSSQEKEWREKSGGNKLLNLGGLLLVSVFILALTALILDISKWATIPMVVSAVLLAIYLIIRIIYKREEAALQRMFADIKNLARELKIEAKDIEGIKSRMEAFQHAYVGKEQELQDVLKKQDALVKVLEQREKDLAELCQEKDDVYEKIVEIKARCGVSDINVYRERLALKKEHEKAVEAGRSILQSILDTNEKDDVAEMSKLWEEELDRLVDMGMVDTGVVYNDELYYSYKKELEISVKKYDDLQAEVGRLDEQLEDFRRDFSRDFSSQDLPDAIKTVAHLSHYQEWLVDFIAYHQKKRQTALEVIDIFNGMKAQDDKKVQDLFGAGKPVSAYFSEITGGNYTGVFMDTGEGIMVQNADGTKLKAWQLSGGAYDQLYFCIRVSLGEKLLSGEKGFFVLDDPFLKSDSRRLSGQIEMLKKLAGNGWQIIYFTAKDEVVGCLRADIASGNVVYHEICASGDGSC